MKGKIGDIFIADDEDVEIMRVIASVRNGGTVAIGWSTGLREYPMDAKQRSELAKAIRESVDKFERGEFGAKEEVTH